MALEFKTYVRKNNLKDEGTVASQIPGGKLKFTPGSLAKYLAGEIKSISMLLLDSKGDSLTAPLSKKVATTIKNALENGRTKKECLAVILKLNVYETDRVDEETGKKGYVIAAPAGSDGEEVEISVGEETQVKLEYSDLREMV